MVLLRKLISFGAPQGDLLLVYTTFVRSIIEQSSNVWHSGLTLEQHNDLERVQKTALKLILQDEYKSYENTLNILVFETLHDRREFFLSKFCKKMSKE